MNILEQVPQVQHLTAGEREFEHEVYRPESTARRHSAAR
jgi:hypothetical protein